MYDSISSWLVGLTMLVCLVDLVRTVQICTVLGPLLFIIRISDISKDVSSSDVISVAVETRVYSNISQSENCDSLQADLNYIYSWATDNNILFNNNKID